MQQIALKCLKFPIPFKRFMAISYSLNSEFSWYSWKEFSFTGVDSHEDRRTNHRFLMKRNPSLCHWNWAGNQTELGCITTFSPIWGYSGQQEHPVREVFGDAVAGSPPPADYLTGSSKGCPCPCGQIFILSEKVGFVGWARLLGRENLSKQKKKKLIETVLLLSLPYFLLSKLTLILWEFTENTT